MTEDIVYLTKEMFLHGCAFLDCANYFMSITNAKDAFIKRYHHPVIVNAAFSCEIFLKTLGMLHNGKLNKKHTLHELYSDLSNEDKEFLKTATDGYNSNLSFDDLLKNISDAFNIWRYSYEKDQIKLNVSYLIFLSEQLRNLCEMQIAERHTNG